MCCGVSQSGSQKEKLIGQRMKLEFNGISVGGGETHQGRTNRKQATDRGKRKKKTRKEAESDSGEQRMLEQDKMKPRIKTN